MGTLLDVTLIIGGASSGKTAFAEGLVTGSGRGPVYLATAEARDDEMKRKIAKHRAERGTGWQLIEEPLDIGRTLPGISGDRAVLLDCATMWLSNQMLAGNDLAQAEAELMAGLALCSAPVVIVTNEVGSGGVADKKLMREFQAAQGVINQKLAARAALVVQVVAGLPNVLKGTLP